MKKKKKILISIGILFALVMITLVSLPGLTLNGDMPIKLLIPESQFNSISSIKLKTFKGEQDVRSFKENGYIAFYVFAGWGADSRILWEKGSYSIVGTKLLIDWKDGTKSEHDLSYIKQKYFMFPKKEWKINLNKD